MELAKWREENGQYLAASLAWLRMRLSALAQQTQGPASPGVFGRRKQIDTPNLQEAAAAREKAALMDPAPALHLLADQLRLTAFERDVVLLCAAIELDTRIPDLCSQAMGSASHTHPSFALALSLFDDPSWDALSPQRPLRFWQLIDVNQSDGKPLTSAPLRADERVVNYIKGLNSLDARLSIHLSPVGAAADLPPSQQAKAEEIIAHWSRVNGAPTASAAVLLGVDTPAKLLVASAVSRHFGRDLYRIGVESLPAQPAEVESLARLWQRESALLPLTLYVDAQTEGGTSESRAALDRFVTRAIRSDSLIFVGSREPLGRAGFLSQPYDIARPTPDEQAAEWKRGLGILNELERDLAAARLAGQFSLNCSDIRYLISTVPQEPVETLANRLWDQCRDRSRPRLDTLAQRIDPRATWNDLVVTEDTERLLREIVAQVACRGTVYGQWQFARRMNRGLGITALFTGESGTGKTMAAEVIANDLRLSLYRIDLSQVVSKYIGETEKNLQRVFDVMEGGGSILFFDEADALFGKRSEVRDSHDRYANIEVNYLLQRMETYTGLAILATNMKGALDHAFLRRLRFIVPFNFPSPAERRLLWQKVFPEALPVDALDYDRLSRLSLTGAGIHSVALNAAFLAAHIGGPVTMPLILKAARTEFRKMDRPMSETEFRA